MNKWGSWKPILDFEEMPQIETNELRWDKYYTHEYSFRCLNYEEPLNLRWVWSAIRELILN